MMQEGALTPFAFYDLHIAQTQLTNNK